MSDAKPVDLVAIRRRIDGCHDAHTVLTVDAPDMAREIEALRGAASLLLRRLNYEPIGMETLFAAEAVSALLPEQP